MRIRKARKEDIKSVSELYDAVHSAEECGQLTIGWDRNVYPVKETAAAALARGDLFVGETDTGTIIGAGIINKIQAEGYDKGSWRYPAAEQEVMVLHTLVIMPAVHDRGYGNAFVEFYENYAKEHDCPILRIDTNERNVRARRFYQKRGYQEAGIVRTSFNGLQDIGLVLLEKKISADGISVASVTCRGTCERV